MLEIKVLTFSFLIVVTTEKLSIQHMPIKEKNYAREPIHQRYLKLLSCIQIMLCEGGMLNPSRKH